MEVLLVDDASTDDTEAVARTYAKQDPRFVYWRNDANVGGIKNQDCCTHHAKGECVTILQSDDRYTRPQFLAEALVEFKNDPALVMCFAATRYVDEQGQVIRLNQSWPDDWRLGGRDALKRLLRLGGFWPSAAVFRAEPFRRIGGFRSDLGVGQDLYCAFRICLEGRVAYRATPAVDAMMQERSVTVTYGARIDPEIVRVLHVFLEDVRGDEALERSVLDAIAAYQAGPRWAVSWQTLVERIDRWVVLWRRQDARIVVYGAGQHTRQLLETSRLKDARIIALADSETELAGRSRFGYPVVSPAEIAELRPDVVLISSATYQDPIYDRVRHLNAIGVEIVRPYSDQPAADPPGLRGGRSDPAQVSSEKSNDGDTC
jgi:glycosyltransferase involved in cell wall biosynthesis